MFELPTNPYPVTMQRHDVWCQASAATLQAVVKYLDEPCQEHRYAGQLYKRNWCSVCMAQLRQAAGGEG